MFARREQFTINLRRTARETKFKIKRMLSQDSGSIVDLLKRKDSESSKILINLAAQYNEQAQLIISLGGVEYFYDQYQSQDFIIKDLGIWGMANLCSELEAQKQLLRLGVLNELINNIHNFSDANQTSSLWLIGALCKNNQEIMEQQQEFGQKILSLLMYYLNVNRNSEAKEECIVGITNLVKILDYYDNLEIIKCCIQNIDQINCTQNLKLVSQLVEDDIQIIQYLRSQNFMEIANQYMKSDKNILFLLIILQYYCQYYTEQILQHEELSKQIKTFIIDAKYSYEVQLLIYNMLFRSSLRLYQTIYSKFNVLESLQYILTNQFNPIRACFIISLIKQQTPNEFKQLISSLEQVFYTNKSTKIQNMVDRLLKN